MTADCVLVTGAGGYLGGRLSAGMKSAGRDVIPLTLDLRSDDSVRRAFADVPHGASLLHLAAANEILCQRDLSAALEINGVGTQRVLDAAVEARIRRVLFFSTFHIYGSAEPIEDAVPDPLHPYGISKQVGEQLCRAAAHEHGLELAIVRLSNAVGAPATVDVDRWSLLCLDLCRQAHERKRLRLQSSGWQERDFVGVGDVQRAVELLLDANPAALAPITFNVGSGRGVQVRELARQIQSEYAAMYGTMLPLEIPDGPAVPSVVRMSIDRIRALGFAPSEIGAELRDTLRFCERFRSTDPH